MIGAAGIRTLLSTWPVEVAELDPVAEQAVVEFLMSVRHVDSRWELYARRVMSRCEVTRDEQVWRPLLDKYPAAGLPRHDSGVRPRLWTAKYGDLVRARPVASFPDTPSTTNRTVAFNIVAAADPGDGSLWAVLGGMWAGGVDRFTPLGHVLEAFTAARGG